MLSGVGSSDNGHRARMEQINANYNSVMKQMDDDHNAWKKIFDKENKLFDIKKDLIEPGNGLPILLYNELVYKLDLNNVGQPVLPKINSDLRKKIVKVAQSLPADGNFIDLCEIISSDDAIENLKKVTLQAPGNCTTYLNQIKQDLDNISSHKNAMQNYVKNNVFQKCANPKMCDNFCDGYCQYVNLVELYFSRNLINILSVLAYNPSYAKDIDFIKVLYPNLFVSKILVEAGNLLLECIADEIHIKDQIAIPEDVFNLGCSVMSYFLHNHGELINKLQDVYDKTMSDQPHHLPAQALRLAITEFKYLDIYSVIFSALNCKFGDNFFESNEFAKLKNKRTDCLNNVDQILNSIDTSLTNVQLSQAHKKIVHDAKDMLKLYKDCLSGNISINTPFKNPNTLTSAYLMLCSKI